MNDNSVKKIGGVPPAVVVNRLPRYYHCLRDLLNNDIYRVSSSKLAECMNSTSSQIRQDFSYFGGFGQHGYGYNVKFLYTSIGNILGINDYYSAIILGAGHLGIVLAGNSIFTKRGVILRGIFDADPDVIGTAVSSGLTVGGIKTVFDFCEQTKVNIIVLTKYTEYAHKLIAASGSNIRGIWNFTGEKLDVPPEIAVQDVCFSDTLMTLCYYIKTVEEGQSNGGNEAQIPD